MPEKNARTEARKREYRIYRIIRYMQIGDGITGQEIKDKFHINTRQMWDDVMEIEARGYVVNKTSVRLKSGRITPLYSIHFEKKPLW